MVPSDSFIHVDDEPSIEKLAEKINNLLVDDVEYDKYFEWRNRPGPHEYRYGTEEDYGNQGLCKLCHMVNNIDKYRKIETNLHKWWYYNKDYTGDACKSIN